MERYECLACGHMVQPQVVHRMEILPVRGEDTEVLADVGICPDCNAEMSIEELDEATLLAAFNLYRQKHGLMAPEEMRELRSRYGLGVRPFSLLLGWGELTLHRYESGSLQDPAHDALLHMAEEPANIKRLLTANGHKLTSRQRATIGARLRALEVETCTHTPVFPERFVVREEQDAYGGWTPMQLSKLREMMLYFAQLEDMYQTKLNKLLFYADFLFFRAHQISISGSPYLAFQHGPVSQHYPWIEEDLVAAGELKSEEVFFQRGGSGVVLSSLRSPDLTMFSAEELATLKDVRDRLGSRTSKELSELSHRERAWTQTERGRFISYEFAKDLRL